MTRSRHPHHEVEPAPRGAHNGPETEIVAFAIGEGRGGPPADTNGLSKNQRDLLAALTRLDSSLRGPQLLLEAAGNFNRPQFPAPPGRDDSTDTSGS